MNNGKRVLTILAGLLALFAPMGAADAATGGKRPTVQSICETGYRGMPAYDAKCLRTGTFKDGAMLWLTTPAGKKGRESRDNFDRRSICKYAKNYGGIAPAVREMYNDVAYDQFRNYRTVLTYAGLVAKIDCRSMGYRV